MPNPSERKPRITGVFSSRGLLLIALIVLLLAAAGGGVVRWFYGLPPDIDGPAFYNRLAAEESGDLPFDSPDNAVVHYRRIFDEVLGLSSPTAVRYPGDAGNTLFRRWQNGQRDSTLSNLRNGEWDDPRQVEGRALLADLRPVLEALDLAADARRFRPRYSASNDIFNPDDSDGPVSPMGMRATHIGLFRSLGTLNAAQIRASGNANDWSDVVRRVRTGMRHTRHLANEPLAWAPYWGVAMDSDTLQEVRFLINEHELTLGVCDELIAQIEEAGPIRNLATTLGVHRITFPSLIRYDMVGERGGVASVYLGRSLLYNPPPRLSLRDGEQFFDELDAYLALPYARRSSLPIPNPGAAGDYLPALGRVIDQFDAVVAQRAATLILLRLERFHA